MGSGEEEREWGTIALLFVGFVVMAVGLGISRGDLTFYSDSRPFFLLGVLCLVPFVIKVIIGLASLIATAKR